ncbi:uncharacterized protein NEMAJ01_0675 [Nematocida major]|uniref:uncharacterized protein n=1 Tax=Nematocida major TaxID=1912982 RepID=UPI0020081FAB|nr:uncharacterized protein NEMAJ01_0675 [Nematocida major]KAH9385779.1 hypothetical protein NEMAJ01_0675 [Nematocida major]
MRIFIGILMAQQICARLSFSQIERINSMVFEDGAESRTINTTGPLNMARGYIYRERGFMHNKRFFSPEIRTVYSAGHLEDSASGNVVHTYERHPEKDSVFRFTQNMYIVKPYTFEYHTALIYMFPSEDGELSIETKQEDSFFNFLQERSVRGQDMYILASLLLLSEGVEVDLEYEKDTKKITLWKNNEDTRFFKAKMQTRAKAPQPNGAEFVEQTKAACIIQFFKNYRKAESPPYAEDVFAEGGFLNSMQFLIQTYLFEYISTEEDMRCFCMCLCKILEDTILFLGRNYSTEVAQRNAVDALNRCFAVAGKHPDPLLSGVKAICEFKEAAGFPFIQESQMNTDVPVQEHGATAQGLGVERLSCSNSVEMCIYFLLCSIIYDKQTKSFCLDRIPNASEEMQMFFHLYSEPEKTVGIEMQKSWGAVFSSLACESIVYRESAIQKERTLHAGFLNMLLAIYEITGRLACEQGKLLAIQKRLKQNVNPGIKAIKEIIGHIENMISDFSGSPGASVVLQHPISKPGIDGGLDVYGTLVILFNSGEAWTRFELSMLHEDGSAGRPGPAGVKIDSNRLDCLNKAAARVSQIMEGDLMRESFSGSLLRHYATTHIDGFQRSSRKYLENTICLAKNIVSGSKSMNALFVMEKIECWKKKDVIAAVFLANYRESRSCLKNPHISILRMVHNVIGSVSLGHRVAYCTLLCIPILLGAQEDLPPSIAISDLQQAEAFKDLSLNDTRIYIIALLKCPSVMLEAFYTCSRKACDFWIASGSAKSIKPYILHAVFECLFKKGDMAAACELSELILQDNREQAQVLDQELREAWASISSGMQDISQELAYAIHIFAESGKSRFSE